MPYRTKRITAGPLERMLLGGTDIYPNNATADLAIEQLEDFRRQRSAGSWREYPVLAVNADGHAGQLQLVMKRGMLAEVMGGTGGVLLSAIRLEFTHFTIGESQHRVDVGMVDRELVLATDVEAPETMAQAMIGRDVNAVMTLPPVLAAVFGKSVIESARTRGNGTAYGFSQ